MGTRLSNGTMAVAAFALILNPLFAGSVLAQEDIAKYPTRAISFISPFPAGTSSDLASRLIAKEAEKFLDKPVLVMNRPGGATTIGAAAVAAAKPDGYTIGYIAPSSLFVAPFLGPVPYHPLKDFQQIIQFGETTFGASVKTDSPFKDFRDVLDFARKNPQKLAYGSSGTNSILNITFEKIAKDNGLHHRGHQRFSGALGAGEADPAVHREPSERIPRGHDPEGYRLSDSFPGDHLHHGPKGPARGHCQTARRGVRQRDEGIGFHRGDEEAQLSHRSPQRQAIERLRGAQLQDLRRTGQGDGSPLSRRVRVQSKRSLWGRT
ncbi:MAG: hypothetical protein HYU75_22730 [Betaproteobacteria bacterium]|nr:hypothetical protein [Betaproteobacteria bacterium]